MISHIKTGFFYCLFGVFVLQSCALQEKKVKTDVVEGEEKEIDIDEIVQQHLGKNYTKIPNENADHILCVSETRDKDKNVSSDFLVISADGEIVHGPNSTKSSVGWEDAHSILIRERRNQDNLQSNRPLKDEVIQVVFAKP